MPHAHAYRELLQPFDCCAPSRNQSAQASSENSKTVLTVWLVDVQQSNFDNSDIAHTYNRVW